jgi:hypothetical protein
MRRLSRIVLLTALAALAPVLAGCESVDFDKLDFLGINQKKALPGDRKPVFPEGVPGVSQGIPKEYQKGYGEQQQQQSDTAMTQPAVAPEDKKTAAVQPVEKPKPKPKPKPKRVVKHKPKPKPKPAATAAAPANSSQAAQQQSPWPAPGQQQQQSQSPWPSTPPPPPGNASQ